jgi:hypothetical protein
MKPFLPDALLEAVAISTRTVGETATRN